MSLPVCDKSINSSREERVPLQPSLWKGRVFIALAGGASLALLIVAYALVQAHVVQPHPWYWAATTGGSIVLGGFAMYGFHMNCKIETEHTNPQKEATQPKINPYTDDSEKSLRKSVKSLKKEQLEALTANQLKKIRELRLEADLKELFLWVADVKAQQELNEGQLVYLGGLYDSIFKLKEMVPACYLKLVEELASRLTRFNVDVQFFIKSLDEIWNPDQQIDEILPQTQEKIKKAFIDFSVKLRNVTWKEALYKEKESLLTQIAGLTNDFSIVYTELQSLEKRSDNA